MKKHKKDHTRVEPLKSIPEKRHLEDPLMFIEMGIVIALALLAIAFTIAAFHYLSHKHDQAASLHRDALQITNPRTFTITDAAGKGSIVISLLDGSVKLINEPIQRSGPVLWSAMEASGYAVRPFQITKDTSRIGNLEFRFDNGSRIIIDGATGIAAPDGPFKKLDPFWTNLQIARHFEPQEGYDPKPLPVSTTPPVAKKLLHRHANLREDGALRIAPKADRDRNVATTSRQSGFDCSNPSLPTDLRKEVMPNEPRAKRCGIHQAQTRTRSVSRKFHPSRLGQKNLDRKHLGDVGVKGAGLLRKESKYPTAGSNPALSTNLTSGVKAEGAEAHNMGVGTRDTHQGRQAIMDKTHANDESRQPLDHSRNSARSSQFTLERRRCGVNDGSFNKRTGHPSKRTTVGQSQKEGSNPSRSTDLKEIWARDEQNGTTLEGML